MTSFVLSDRPTRPWGLRSVPAVALVATCVLGMVFAWRPTAEFSAHMAVDVSVRQLAGPFARVFLPEGLDTETFRPLSVVFVRLLAAFGGPLDPVASGLKGASAILFAVAALRWSRATGAGWKGALAAWLTVLSPAGWFNVVHFTEFDLLGAALLLEGDRALRGDRPIPRAVLPLFLALILKDSVALSAITLVGAHVLLQARSKQADLVPLAALLVGALLTFLLSGAVPTRLGHGAPLSAAGQAAFVLGAQWAALLGPAALVVLAAPPPFWGRWTPAALGLIALPWLLPDPAFQSLFLCFLPADAPIGSPLSWGSLAVVLALGFSSWRRTAAPQDAGVLAAALFTGVFIVLPALMRMRDDTSTRVLLPVLPFVYEAVIRRFVVVATALRGGFGAQGTALVLCLLLPLMWQGVAPGLSFLSTFLAQESAELQAKRTLAEAISGPSLVVGTDRIWEITGTELRALRPGLPPPVLTRTNLLPLGSEHAQWLDQVPIPPTAAAEVGWPTYVYAIGWESAASPAACAALLAEVRSFVPPRGLPRLGPGPVDERARACATEAQRAAPFSVLPGARRGALVRSAALSLPWTWGGAIRELAAGRTPWELRRARAEWWVLVP